MEAAGAGSFASAVRIGDQPKPTTGLGFPVGIFLTTGVAQRFATTHGRRLIQVGLSVLTAGMVLLILIFSAAGTDVSFWQLALPILVMGLGMCLCVSILTTVVLAAVPDRSAGAGSGVTNAVLQFGAAVGVAVVGTLMFALANESAGDPAAAARPLVRRRGHEGPLVQRGRLPARRAAHSTVAPRRRPRPAGQPGEPDRDPATVITT